MNDRERDLADVTALVDGSLPAERRPEVERRVASSPELMAVLERQRRALEAVRGAAAPAPPTLRARVGARPAPRRRLATPALGLAAVAAAVVVLLVVPGGGPEAPSVADAASLAARAPASKAPRPLPAVDGVRFPRWDERFAWRADGVRFDRLRGRAATTVYYRYDGKRIAYTIVAGRALAEPAGWRRAVRADTRLSATRLGSRTVVTWRRGGRTCVLSGAGVSPRTLLTLAAWPGGS